MLKITFVAVLVSAIFAIGASDKLYEDKYDFIEPLNILTNDRLRKQYYKCFLDAGPCITADAKFFRKYFPDAVVTQCVRCTKKQKVNFGTIVEWYVVHRPEQWQALVAKFIADAKTANTSSA